MSEKTGIGQRAERCIDKIIDDLADRHGIGNEWHQIDDDVQAEIRDAWMLIIRRELEKP